MAVGDRVQTYSEVALCDRLRAWAERLGFSVYPEVFGWDLVLTTSEPRQILGLELPPGEQLGIHAKLRANCDVLVQAAPPSSDYPNNRYGPTWPFVAVPRAGRSFCWVADRLGVGVIVTDYNRRGKADPLEARSRAAGLSGWPRRSSAKPLPLPSFASRAIRAGSPSPRVLSAWRESALRFLIHARSTTDGVTMNDVRRFGLSKQFAARALVATGKFRQEPSAAKRGRLASFMVYELSRNPEHLPDWGYGDVARELEAALATAVAAPGAELVAGQAGRVADD